MLDSYCLFLNLVLLAKSLHIFILIYLNSEKMPFLAADEMPAVSCRNNMSFSTNTDLFFVNFSMHWVNNLPGTLQQVSHSFSQFCR